MADLVVLNQPLRKHESKSGKVRFSISLKSEPIIFNLNPKDLGNQVAEAMAKELRTRVESISVSASPATIKARESAAKALAANKPWAVKRYSGGKTGLTPPNQSHRAFNDSGRFAKGIVAQAAPGKWRINVPANRLDPATGNVDRIWARLIELVPAFGDTRLLLDSEEVRAGVHRGLDTLVASAPMTYDQISAAKARNLLLFIAQIAAKAAA